MILQTLWFKNDFIAAERYIEVYTKYALGLGCFPAMTNVQTKPEGFAQGQSNWRSSQTIPLGTNIQEVATYIPLSLTHH
jgi:hypothetical protein